MDAIDSATPSASITTSVPYTLYTRLDVVVFVDVDVVVDVAVDVDVDVDVVVVGVFWLLFRA